MEKYSGCGNTFFLFDNRNHELDYSLVTSLCGEEVDGLIALEGVENGAHRMRIFNRDGSEAEMCGNGVRCFVQFLHDIGIREKKYTIVTPAGTLYAWLEGGEVLVQMSPPSNFHWDLSMQGYTLHFLNTGVPHAVIFVEDIEGIDVRVAGRKLRYDPFFAPYGTNVTFVQLMPANTLMIRTYERGVEGETLACGTGAVAASLAAAKKFHYSSPITVIVRSKERLTLTFTEDFHDVKCRGSAKKLEGVLA